MSHIVDLAGSGKVLWVLSCIWGSLLNLGCMFVFWVSLLRRVLAV